MRTSIFGLLLSLLVLGVIAGCKEEKQVSFMPTWKGISYTPQQPRHGDSVTITALQAEVGDGIYGADYTWTMTFRDPATGKDSIVTSRGLPEPTVRGHVVYDYDKSDPSVKFKMPDETDVTMVTVRFQGVYNFSSDGIQHSDGSNYTSPEIQGTVSQSAWGVMAGESRGSVIIQL